MSMTVIKHYKMKVGCLQENGNHNLEQNKTDWENRGWEQSEMKSGWKYFICMYENRIMKLVKTV
jgi:hypothetical protein